MFYIIDYFTDEIVDVVGTFERAKAICDAHDGSQIKTESSEILYSNVELPF